MEFRAEHYGADIARILASAGGGLRPMPLARSTECSANRPDLAGFPGTVAAGLYLYLGHWDAAHSAADAVENPDGYFWHGIVHRQEPDPDNSAYWFRKTGTHPVFPALAAAARNVGYQSGGAWDPFAFIAFCESAVRHPGSPQEQAAIRVQLAEWQLLFDHCARGQKS